MAIHFADSLIDPALLALELPPEPHGLSAQSTSPEKSLPAAEQPTTSLQEEISSRESTPEVHDPGEAAREYVARVPLDGRPQVRSRALNKTAEERSAAAKKAAEKKRRLNVEVRAQWEQQTVASAELAAKHGVGLKTMLSLTQHQPGYGQHRKPNLYNAWVRANALKINEGEYLSFVLTD